MSQIKHEKLYTVPTNQYIYNRNRKIILKCIGKIHRDDVPPSKIAMYKEYIAYYSKQNKKLSEVMNCI